MCNPSNGEATARGGKGAAIATRGECVLPKSIATVSWQTCAINEHAFRSGQLRHSPASSSRRERGDECDTQAGAYLVRGLQHGATYAGLQYYGGVRRFGQQSEAAWTLDQPW